MNLLTYFRKLFGKDRKEHHFEYVNEVTAALAPEIETEVQPQTEKLALKQNPSPGAAGSEEVIAFSHQGDLESYVKALNVPSEVIEGWISAGVLSPEETRVAAKMIRMIKTKRHHFDTPEGEV